MRDLRPGDRISADERMILTPGGAEPLCWKNTKDWARWWLRQAELNEWVSIPLEQRKVFQAILDTED